MGPGDSLLRPPSTGPTVAVVFIFIVPLLYDDFNKRSGGPEATARLVPPR